MNILIKNKEDVKNTKDGIAFLFLDSSDQKLKMKKGSEIIEFNFSGDSGDTTPTLPTLPTVTVTSDNLLNGITAINSNGDVVTGNIQTVTLQRDGNKVSIGKGYVSKADSIEITQSGTEGDVIISIENESLEFNLDRYQSEGKYINGSTNNNQSVYYYCESIPYGFSLNQSTGYLSFRPDYITSSSDENSFKIIVFSSNALSKEVIVKYSVDAESGEIYYEIWDSNGSYDYETEQFNMTSFINENFTFNFNNYGSLYSSNNQTLNYSIKSGNLPAGLTFNNSNGQINGTPTSTFTGSITVEITAYKCDTKSYQINLNFIAPPKGLKFSDPWNWNEIASGTTVTDFDKIELFDNYRRRYVKINLTGGTEYTFWCTSDDADDFDEYLRLFNMNEEEVAYNDDADGGSRFTYTPDATGDFILCYCSYSDDGLGKFSECTVTPAPNNA